MADETQNAWLAAEVVLADEQPTNVAALYAEVTHQTTEFFPLQFASVYAEVTHQTHDVYQTEFASVHMEVLRSLYNAIRPGPTLLADDGDQPAKIWPPIIPAGTPKFTIANVERNPYAAHLPQTPEESVEHQAEQQKILREQHNKTQAGDTTFDYGLLLKEYTTKEFTLGSLGKFYHPDHGMILARFCQFGNFIDSLSQGMPVGRLKTPKNTAVDWIVTNDLDKSGADLVMGLAFLAATPKNKTFGWVVVNGVNPTAVSNLAAEKPQQNQAFGWAESNRLVADAEGPVVARTWGWTQAGTLPPGTLYIEVERWSVASLRKFFAAETQDMVARLDKLEVRMGANEEESKKNATSIKDANAAIATLRKNLEREIELRSRQIAALQGSLGNESNAEALQALRNELEKRIGDGDQAGLKLIRALEQEVVNLKQQLAGLDPAQVGEQLDNLSNAVGFLSSQFANLYVPTTTGLTLVSAKVGTNEDGTDRLGFIQIAYKLSNLADVDVTTSPPTNGQVLAWSESSAKFVPMTVSGGGGGSSDVEPTAIGPSGYLVEGGAHKWWRVNCPGTLGWDSIMLSEVQFREEVGVNQLMTGGVPFANSQLTGETGPAAAFDNNGGTFWHTAGGYSGIIGYRFPQPVAVRELMLRLRDGWLEGGPSSFNVDWSDDDGATWTTEWDVPAPGFTTGGETRLFQNPVEQTAKHFYPTHYAALNDVDWTEPADGQVMIWDSADKKFKPGTIEGGSGGGGGGGGSRIMAAGRFEFLDVVTPVKAAGLNFESVERLSTGHYRVHFTNPIDVTKAGVNIGGRYGYYESYAWPQFGIPRNGDRGFFPDYLDIATKIHENNATYDFDGSAGSFISFEIYDVSQQSGGGSGGGSGGPSPFYATPPAVPQLADFDLEVGNGVVTTPKQTSRGILLDCMLRNTDTNTILTQDIPAGDFDLKILVSAFFPFQNYTNISAVIKHGPSGRMVTGGIGKGRLRGMRWSDMNSYNGSYEEYDFDITQSSPIWIRCKRIGNQVEFLLSADGEGWMGLFNFNQLDWLGVPTMIGLFVCASATQFWAGRTIPVHLMAYEMET